MTVGPRDRWIAALTCSGGPFELSTRLVDGTPMLLYTVGPHTLGDVLEASRAFGERDYLVYGADRLSYADNYRIARSVADFLVRDCAMRPGDRVAVAMRNYPEWGPIFWGAILAGLVVVPINAWWTAQEMEFALRDCGATVLFADQERLKLLQDGSEPLAIPIVAVRSEGSEPGGVTAWADLISREVDPAWPAGHTVSPTDAATILYTSGTTGRPKGAVGTHRNHCSNLLNSRLSATVAAGLASGREPDSGSAPVTAAPALLNTLPFFHIAGLSMLTVTALSGGRVVTMHRWNVREAQRLIRNEQLTMVAGVPTVIGELTEAAMSSTEDTRTLNAVRMGATPIPPDLIARLETTFGGRVNCSSGYGITETTSSIASIGGSDFLSHPGSVGRGHPTVQLRVVDPETGDTVPDGSVGELYVRGPTIVRGYWNDPVATAESFIDGWYATGDLGYLRDGLLYLVDRRKDVIIRGGENVYASEVDNALLQHPDVLEAAAFGIPERALGERVVAVVRPRPGAVQDEDGLRAHVAAQLAAFKVPSRIGFVDRPLPRTATGKVLKRDIRQQYLAGHPDDASEGEGS